ncbi:MAG TPA: hypothetical protein VD948_01095, partial [Rhodothermales bacterium]|nr:hypothetical protein [Rhodothermales bacterium]
PTSIYGVTFNGGTLPLWLGVALAEKVVNSNANGTSADITISVNSTFANWHTGTGTPPSDKFDLESVILHELGHGLNFFALSEYNTGTGVGTITFTSGSFTGQGIFDYFMYDAATGGNALRNTAAYANASTALGSAFTGGSVYLNGTNGIAQNGNARPQIYAPNPYNAGSSLSHLNETTFNGSLNALMTYAIAPGEMARTPGPVACGIMADMVWTVNQAACTSLALPVEMVAFDAVAEGSAALLRWQTASETDNAGWAVERRAAPGDDAWRQVAFVAGRGTTSEAHAYEQRVAGLLPGRHTFRLRQIDLDGRVSLTPEVEVVLYVDGTGLLSAAMPNPTRGPAHLSVAVRVTQHVRVEALDGLGRRVAVLFEGDVVPESPQQVAFDPAGLPAGLYLIRAIGTHFVSTRPVAVVR